jgi:pSer/pThr/pTyr-binding forkhead associated (FHA) protein
MSARLIGRTGPTAGRDFPLMGVATIGASADSEIRIVAPGVSRRHARIIVEQDQYYVEDAGAINGTFLNGGRVQREALRHLDVITLGRDVDLIFIKRDGETPAPRADGVTNARVRITDGAEAGTVVDVPKGELTFGRAPSCNVVLASGLVSKVHARIQRTANQVVLQDLQSINGTFVNGARVDSMVVLKTGDVISFAGVRSATVTIDASGGAPGAANVPDVPSAMAEPSFSQEWKTRFVWAPEELALIEAARAEAMQLAALRAPDAAGAAAEKKPAAAAKPVAPGPAKAEGNIAGAAPAAKAAAPPPAAKADVKPAGPAQAAVQQAAAVPIKPGTPVPITPEPAKPKEEEPAPTMMVMPAAQAARDGDATMPGVARAPRLRGIRLIGPGIPITLGLGTFIVGRAVGSDVRLDDRQVSRSHARITIDETSASVEDLQTANGTLVNGKEVKARQPLRPGDTVQFGAAEFKVELTTT